VVTDSVVGKQRGQKDYRERRALVQLKLVKMFYK
jgi:hypothetical protein